MVWTEVNKGMDWRVGSGVDWGMVMVVYWGVDWGFGLRCWWRSKPRSGVLRGVDQKVEWGVDWCMIEVWFTVHTLIPSSIHILCHSSILITSIIRCGLKRGLSVDWGELDWWELLIYLVVQSAVTQNSIFIVPNDSSGSQLVQHLGWTNHFTTDQTVKWWINQCTYS